VSPRAYSTGINGFGRFGLHLLRYWIVNYRTAQFTIDYINDEGLALDSVADIIRQDPYLDIKDRIRTTKEAIEVRLGKTWHVVQYTNESLAHITWLGQPAIFLECSGKYTAKEDWRDICKGNTGQVIISATSWQADQTLVYGYNHTNFSGAPVVSYGSCTVNAYIPLAAALHAQFKILDSDVNVIHNVPHYQLGNFDTLTRKTCTLELVAPHLLPFITSNNFKVNYTLVPYSGVSIIDYRFRLQSATQLSDIKAHLESEITHGTLKGLYSLQKHDSGPATHKFADHSAVLIESTMTLAGDNLYIHAYFDNENSVNRYFDLLNYISKELQT
jgi:glyceraldehyde 3-phosphate dehydrogenase